MVQSLARCMARWTWLLGLLVAVSASGCSSALTCTAGQTACGNACVDLQTDALHCGGCNTTCNSGAACTAGVCVCAQSTPDTCGVKCVNKQTDPANCGSCGHACGPGTCAGGACDCSGGPATTILCPDDPATGVCVDTTSNAANCGGCGPNPPFKCIPGEVCASSTCVCDLPREVCGTGTSAVCTDTLTDPENCGGCGTICGAGLACSQGLCVQTCLPGQTLCGTVCVDLQTDAAHCGTCATTCATGQFCSAGRCQAACATRTCGSTCCADMTACCGTSCPYQHKNFIGTPEEQTYYDCTPPEHTVVTAQKAASVWANDVGTVITTSRACPSSGGSTCLTWQRDSLIGTDAACGVWCYFGALEGTVLITQGYACPCPSIQGTDWY